MADHLASRWRLGSFKRGERARQVEGSWNGTPVRILKPQTYMNRSGAALAPLSALPGFDPATDLLVLVDDVALSVGRFRLRGAGSAGGHNGLKSIEGVLQRLDYARQGRTQWQSDRLNATWRSGGPGRQDLPKYGDLLSRQLGGLGKLFGRGDKKPGAD